MNKQRREAIRNAMGYIDQARYLISGAKDGEEEAFDSFPENLQASQRGEQMESNIESMDEILEYISDIEELVEGIL